MYKIVTSLSTILLFSLSLNTQAAAPITSVYTALEGANCKTLESSEEGGGWYKGRCKGMNAYDLLIMEGDLRQTITIVDPKKKSIHSNFGIPSPAAFLVWVTKPNGGCRNKLINLYRLPSLCALMFQKTLNALKKTLLIWSLAKSPLIAFVSPM